MWSIALRIFILFSVTKISGLGLSLSQMRISSLAFTFSEDALVSLMLAFAFDKASQHRLQKILLLVLALWCGVQSVLYSVLFTPLTLRLFYASGGALSDSFRTYFTFANALRFTLPFLLIQLKLPFERVDRKMKIAIAVLAVGAFFPIQDDFSHWRKNSLVVFGRSLRRTTTTKKDFVVSYPRGAKSEISQFGRLAKGQNLILIGLESTGARYLNPYGNTRDPMPTLTALGKQGIRFSNAFAAYPESIKGFYSLLCATMPHIETDVEKNLAADQKCLPHLFRENGYTSLLFHSGRFDYLDMDKVVAHVGFGASHDAGKIKTERQTSFGLNDERDAVRHILNWISNREKGTPFFIHYLPVAGHHPYPSPEPGPFSGSDEFTQYLNSIHHADDAIQELIRGLEKSGELTRTWLVFYGDHGEAFGQHPGNFAHTLFIFEENVHVPLWIIPPPGLRKEINVTTPVSLIDIAPTLSDIFFGATMKSVDGQSATRDRDREPVFFFTDYGNTLMGVRRGKYKSILDAHTKKSWHFNIETDPEEKHSGEKVPKEISDENVNFLTNWLNSRR